MKAGHTRTKPVVTAAAPVCLLKNQLLSLIVEPVPPSKAAQRRNKMKSTIGSLMTLVLGAAFATGAFGGCIAADPSINPSARAAKAAAARFRSVRPADSLLPLDTPAGAADSLASIVGLWDIQYFAGGMFQGESFEIFYSDGNEAINDLSPILEGNYCVGVWAQTGPRTFALHHVTWIFDDQGMPGGRGTEDAIITLDPSGKSFSATGSGQGYDLDGKLLGAGPFTAKATRITLPASSNYKGSVTKAIAGPKDATVLIRQVTLDGSASTSADGKPLTYYWTLASGSLPAAITQSTTATPVVSFGSGRGSYTFILTISDSQGNIDTDRVTITYEGI
jgi:PKD domain